MLTQEQIAKALPANLRGSASPAFTALVNGIVTDPLIAEQVRGNFISYTSVLSDGKYKTEDYLNAVTYVSFKLMGQSNNDAYMRTFQQRYSALLAKGATPKDISAYVSAYNKGKLVNAILEQTLVPPHVLNAHVFQKAINRLVTLMDTAQSEKVQSDSAIGLLTHLAMPKAVGPLVALNLNTGSGMEDLRAAMEKLAVTQLDLIERGVTAKALAAQPIVQPVTIEHEEE